MTAGSGRKWSALFEKRGPIGCFVKTLLESSMWASTEYLLEWKPSAWHFQRQRLLSVQATFDKKTCTWAYSVKTSKRWVTNSPRRLSYRLVPSTPPTDGRGIGLWLTPNAQDQKLSDGPKAVAAYREGAPSTSQQRLRNQVKATWQTPARHQFEKRRQVGQETRETREELLLPGQVKATWPTPNCRDEDKFQRRLRTDGGQVNLSGLAATWPTPRSQERQQGNSQDAGMSTGKMVKATWPTVTKQDASGHVGAYPQTPTHHEGLTLATAATYATWPTPKSSPNGPDYARRNRKGSGGDDLVTQAAASGMSTSGCLARTESFVECLMTLSSWLLGYTVAYLRHWGTASSRRSRQK